VFHIHNNGVATRGQPSNGGW